MDSRKRELNDLVPKDVRTILDVGCDNNLFDRYETKTLDIKNADILQDLNKSQKLSLKNDEVDRVILSQILEHLVTVDEIVSESKRIAKKYILVGLPNEVAVDNRIRFLLGKAPGWGSYFPYGHKHFFIIKEIEKFIIRFFGNYEKRYFLFGVKGGKISTLKDSKNISKFISYFICRASLLFN